MTVRGGALLTYPFDPSVDASRSSSRPTAGRSTRASSCCRVRTTTSRSSGSTPRTASTAFAYLMTPGSGNVVRIVNGPVEFPMTASVLRSTTTCRMTSSSAAIRRHSHANFV